MSASVVGLARTLRLAAVERTRTVTTRRPGPALALAAILVLVAVNGAVLMLPIDWSVFGGWAYPGVFLVTFIANAAIALPVPYLAIVAQVSRTAELPSLVIAVAALASVLGESVAYAIGRAQRELVADHRLVVRLRNFVGRPFRAALLLFALSVPLNPFFDVAGVAAGALGIPYKVFFAAVFTGRLVRFAIIVWGLAQLLG